MNGDVLLWSFNFFTNNNFHFPTFCYFCSSSTGEHSFGILSINHCLKILWSKMQSSERRDVHHVTMSRHYRHLLSAAPKIDNKTMMYNIWCSDLIWQAVNINKVKQEVGLVQTFLRNKQFLDPCWLGSQTCCTPVVAHWCSLWEEVVR